MTLMANDSRTDKPSWIKEKKISEDFKTIDCKPFDPYKDFKMDKKCYTLIRVDRNNCMIEVAICDHQHVIHRLYRGAKAQDLFIPIINDGWIEEKEHAAYLGKELKKAEIALALGNEYYQE